MKTKGQKRPKIDWGDVRERMAAAVTATKGAAELSADESLTLMQSRARALAGAAGASAGQQATVEVVLLKLGPESYAIETRFVRQIKKFGSLCRVPGVQAFILGLTPLRGEMLAVVDLRVLLGLPAAVTAGDARLVVLGAEGLEFAIVADAVEQTTMLPIESLAEPAGAADAGGNRWVRGVTPEGRILLDGEALLSDERLFVTPEAGQAD